MTTLYLIRHGEAEGNLYRLMIGRTDCDLTDLGRKQADRLGQRFQSIRLDAVYSSPLHRALQTAAPLCLSHRLPLYTDPRLTEIDVGPWEGLPFGTAAVRNPEEMQLFQHDPDVWRLPGADTIRSLAERGLAALNDICRAHPDQTVAVCFHSYLINAIMCRLFYGFDRFTDTGLSYNTAVTQLFRQDDGSWRIGYTNDYSHLESAGEELIRKGPVLQDGSRPDLHFEPFGSDIDRYIRYRGDAWKLIYGSTKDFNGPAFWLDAQRTIGSDPMAMIHGTLRGTPVGMLQLSPDRDAGKGIGYIPFIYLREPFRGKGLGIQFIGQAVTFYRQLGRSRLQLSVAHTNAHALAFYQKYGFYEAGKTPGIYGKLILMEKKIAFSPLPKKLRILPAGHCN